MRVSLVLVAALAACYQPSSDRACTTRCEFDVAGANAACPSGLTCADSGFCVDRLSTVCDPDGGIIGGGDAATGEFCYGTAPNHVCFATEPFGTLTLSSIATDSCSVSGVAGVQTSMTDVDGTPTCVIAATKIRVSSMVSATGSRQLMLIGTQAITVDPTGFLNVSSVGSSAGAGATSIGCSPAVDAGFANGGGAGGSFHGNGGDGGGANSPGVHDTSPPPRAFRGGCRGGNGGAVASTGGLPGGAVFITTPLITVFGKINASGAGGAGGEANHGGGGGGSGGYIGLDAKTVEINGTARLLVGGGGGGGGSENVGNAGLPGGNPVPGVTGTGGIGAGIAGSGGFGSDAAELNGSRGSNGSGVVGGGGGGGAGFIQFVQPFIGSCDPPNCEPSAER